VLKEYNNYRFTLGRIAKELRPQYVKDISARMKEAREKGELDERLFTDFQMMELNTLIDDPASYTRKYGMAKNSAWLTPEEKALKKIEQLENSAPYRAGRIVTAPRRALKKLYYKIRR